MSAHLGGNLEDEFDPLDTSATSTDYSPSPKLSPTIVTDDNRLFAPLSVPIERRLQTLAVAWHTCTIPVFISLFFLSLTIPLLWPFILFYFLRFFIWDKTPSNGDSFNRFHESFRKWRIWKYYNDYFPITIHKTEDLEPTFTEQIVDVIDYRFPFNRFPLIFTNILNKFGIIKPYTYSVKKQVKTGPRYIFGSHPHGVISMGITGTIVYNGAGFSELFPGIKCFLLTLLNQFQIPFYRDYILAMGVTSVSKRNVMSIIRDHDASVCIVIGGASESLLSYPHRNDIVLKRRKGFVKIALELGDVTIVPVFTFGETNLYEIYSPNPQDKWRVLYKMQWWLKKTFGFTVPLFYARGVFNYDFGLLPHRRPINVVIGRGIQVPFRPSPSIDEINYYHDLYMKGLQRIFDEHKDLYLSPEDGNLKIVQ